MNKNIKHCKSPMNILLPNSNKWNDHNLFSWVAILTVLRFLFLYKLKEGFLRTNNILLKIWTLKKFVKTAFKNIVVSTSVSAICDWLLGLCDVSCLVFRWGSYCKSLIFVKINNRSAKFFNFVQKSVIDHFQRLLQIFVHVQS